MITIMAILFAVSGLAVIPLTGGSADAADGSEEVKMTNSVGTTVTFSEPAQKVASLGLSFTTTLLELGCKERIVMIDNYSAPPGSGLTELEGVASFPVSTGEQIAQLLANGEGGFDKNRDVVFIYGYSYHANAIKAMETLGLKVVTFYPTNYDMGMDMVNKMGAILGLKEKAGEITYAMQAATVKYLAEIYNAEVPLDERIKAAYVSYSGGTLRVGNINSYSVVLMKLAGGINVADDPTMTGSALTSYQVDDTFFVQQQIDVIFLDPYYAGTPDEFRADKNIADDVRIYKLTMIMNQYGPTSMDGIEFMATAMYPEVFGEPDDDGGGGGGDDKMIYIAAVAVVISVIAVAYVALRR
ncbi:MAG: ABC transporter substrate-binding protein [Methanomassiliicoccaceae archaeon]|nr:ABC transporter substrate-binding protein [Methanomassiliicoccaceae archaeon]